MDKQQTIELLMNNIESITNNYDNPISNYYPERRIAFYGGTYLIFDAEYMSNQEWIEDMIDNQHTYINDIIKGIIEYADANYEADERDQKINDILNEK